MVTHGVSCYAAVFAVAADFVKNFVRMLLAMLQIHHVSIIAQNNLRLDLLLSFTTR